MPYPPGQLLTLRSSGNYVLVIEALPGGYRVHDGKIYTSTELSLFEMKHKNNPRERCWTEAEIVYLLQNLNKGKPLREFAAKFNRTKNSVISVIHRKLNGWGANPPCRKTKSLKTQVNPHPGITLPKLPWENFHET